MMLVAEHTTKLIHHLDVDRLELDLLHMQQVECPVVHRFGPGIYIREVTLPAGIVAIGHAQRYEHLNIMLTGKVVIIDGNQPKVLEAPLIFVGQPGRKVGYVLETCTWQNVYATDETNIDKLEAHFLDKSSGWVEAQIDLFNIEIHNNDRDDFYNLLNEIGITEQHVTEQSEYEDDQIPMPVSWDLTNVRDSNLAGKGLFLSYPIKANSIIAPARLGDKRTPAGRYVNHSKYPNCRYEKADNGDIYLVSNFDLRGCIGGSPGTELTVDYRQALSIAGDLTCLV